MANFYEIDGEQSVVCAAKTDLMNRNPAALEAVVLFQNQLEDVAARTGARVGDQTARKIAASGCEG